MRVAAVDCGTNSIRLLIADVASPEGGRPVLTDVLRRTEVVRLGQDVDATGRLDEAALGRTLAMAAEYASQCRQHDVPPGAVRFVATSASRDADNAADFVRGVQDAFGDLDVTPEVVSGREEAQLSFDGATGSLLASGFQSSYGVVDLGGGSTEIARGTHEVVEAISLDIGCVRLTERHLRSDPPTHDEVDAARWDINLALDDAEAAVGFGRIGTLVGLAGSVTTVTAQALGLTTYDRRAIDLARLSVEQAMVACAELVGMTREDRAALGFMHPGRVDVIGAGALIWHEVIGRVVAAAGVDITVTASEHDILDGIALSVPARG